MRQQEIKSEIQLDIEKIIQAVAEKILHSIDIPAKSPLYLSHCDSNLVMLFIKELSDTQLWPMTSACESLSIRDLCKKLEACSFAEFAGRFKQSDHCNKCSRDLVEVVLAATKKAMGSFEGLCLDCVKHHKKGKKDWAKCRVPHTKFQGLEQDRDVVIK